MKICPECGKIANYNSYFGSYICSACSWQDDEPSKIRMEKFRNLCNHGRYERNDEKTNSIEKEKLAAV